ncbi:MAG: DUF5946 family protein [Gemmatimonadetes bacterium]|nr:DUF5946 family protein [Gemmatimonadota bacterium]
MESICDECGARSTDRGHSCATRFDRLLALDHSRQEPWGSRHGLAFAVFALQHPARYPEGTRSRSYELLARVIEGGQSLNTVVRAFRTPHARAEASDPPPRAPGRPFPETIADLGEFDANAHIETPERWCRATVSHLRSRARSA